MIQQIWLSGCEWVLWKRDSTIWVCFTVVGMSMQEHGNLDECVFEGTPRQASLAKPRELQREHEEDLA